MRHYELTDGTKIRPIEMPRARRKFVWLGWRVMLGNHDAANAPPFGYGVVGRFELAVILAPIPFNVVLRWWGEVQTWFLWGGLRRTTLEREYDRGFSAGHAVGMKVTKALSQRL